MLVHIQYTFAKLNCCILEYRVFIHYLFAFTEILFRVASGKTDQ